MSAKRESSVLNWAIVGIVLLLIVGVLGAFAVREGKRRQTAQLNAIVGNLRVIERAKDQWALENKKQTGDVPVVADLTPYLKNNRMPASIVGEIYKINGLGKAASASLPADFEYERLEKISTVTIP